MRTIDAIITRLLFLAGPAIAAWYFIAWIATGAQGLRALQVIVTAPIALVTLLVLAGLVWFAPSRRLTGGLPTTSRVLVPLSWILWVAGGIVPADWAFATQLVAIAVTLASVVVAWRSLRADVAEQLAAAGVRMPEQGGPAAGRAPGAPASPSGPARIITLEADEIGERRESPDGDARR